MLYFVGLGLGDELDITVRGLEVVRACHSVYLEAYTSLLCFGLGFSAISTLVRMCVCVWREREREILFLVYICFLAGEVCVHVLDSV